MTLVRIVCALAVVLVATPGAAQQPVSASRFDLPADVADAVVLRLNDPATDLREGDTVVGPGAPVDADLAVLEGDLTLRGVVRGSVLVVNGDAVLEPGAAISGDLLVVGGRVESSPDATVQGEIASYSARLPYERNAGRVRVLRGPGSATLTDRGGYSDFLITTGRSYNRVEGMPISFGPRIQTEGSNPFRLQALAIYRTESGFRFEPEEMGYYVRADQYIGGRREYRAGGTLFSLVDPIEGWHLSDLESGLATFLFHRDYRDHYQRQGGSVFAAWEPTASPYRLQIEGRWERHATRGVGSPWSLFRNAQEWRPQPVVAEGDLRSVAVQGEFDSRSETWNPATGWLVRGEIERALQVDLVRPALAGFLPSWQAPLPAREYGRFATGMIDVRRYNRINAESRLNFRLVAGGSLTGDPLPPQRQHALGGEGSLPGYLLFESDCGARSSRVTFAGTDDARPYHPDYGCDAFTLFQAEIRGKLDFRLRWDSAPWSDEDAGGSVWDFGWHLEPDWSLFVDAGRGWSHDVTRPDEATRVDVGAGLLVDRIGAYVALPVTGGTGVNVFLRIGPRF